MTEQLVFLDAYINILEKSSKELDISKIIKIPIRHYYEILRLYHKLNEKDNNRYKEKILFSLEYKTVHLMIKEGNFDIPLKLFNQFDSIIMLLSNEKKYHYHYLNLTIKHIYCLLHANLIYEANIRCIRLSNYFKNNFSNKLSECKNNPEKLNIFSDELIQVRSIIKLIMRESEKHNLKKIQLKYQILSKRFELMILKSKTIDKNISDHIQLLPIISYPNDLISTITIYPKLSYTKGFKKLILYLKIKWLIFINRIDNFFWGYGFNPIKIVRSSLIIIVSYSIFMQLELINMIY